MSLPPRLRPVYDEVVTAESGVATEWRSWRFVRIGSGCDNSSQSFRLAEQLALVRCTWKRWRRWERMETSELAVEAATVDSLQSKVSLNRRWW